MNLFTKLSAEKSRNLRRILLVIFLGIVTNFIGFMMGGTKGALIQFNFIVIFLAAYYWKIKGGLLAALILGIIAGPFMPLDVELGIMQTYGNWMFRVFIYLVTAYIAGYTLQKNEESNQQIKDKDLRSHFTGLYNTNKLFLDLDKMIEDGEKFGLVFFNVINLEEISKYVDYKIIKEIIDRGTVGVKSKFEESELYSCNFNQYILVVKEYDEQDMINMLSDNIENISSPKKIEDFEFQLIVKIGIVFNNNIVKSKELYNKAKIAADQGEMCESGVYVYDSNFENERKLFYEISNSIHSAIKNNEFYLVYQPIINLNNNTISSLEVLVRWNRGDRQAVGPSTFIKIAEETGSVQKITMEVIRQLVNQLIDFKKIDIEIKSSVNFTADEIIDDSFVEWIEKIVDENHLNRSNLGIEITERIFSKNDKKLNDVLLKLQNEGYIVSMDDFGTGYNTLKIVEEIKVDILKIDKYFIDRINQKSVKHLIRHTIELAHERGLLVVAEGVETKEQLLILKELGCDNIQGYYFSKPLLAEDFTEYYKSFDMNKYML